MIQEILAAMVGTIAFSLLFGVPRKYYAYCGLIGGAGWGVYSAAGLLWAPAQSALAATIVVILLSRLAAVKERCPVTIFFDFRHFSAGAGGRGLLDRVLYGDGPVVSGGADGLHGGEGGGCHCAGDRVCV